MLTEWTAFIVAITGLLTALVALIKATQRKSNEP